ncbi:hypothetical protein [Hymenobacter terrigena]
MKAFVALLNGVLPSPVQSSNHKKAGSLRKVNRLFYDLTELLLRYTGAFKHGDGATLDIHGVQAQLGRGLLIYARTSTAVANNQIGEHTML